MKKRLARISPLQLGIVLAVLYGLISLLIVLPIGAFSMASSASSHHSALPSMFGGIFLFFVPVLYAVLGFVGGVIVAAIYNVVAGFTGGVEVTVTDVPE